MPSAAIVPLILALTAAPDGPAPAPEPAPEPAEGDSAASASWTTRYDAARGLMMTGRFAEAADRFAELARSAGNRIDRTLAFENAAICREWADRRLVLAPAGSAAAQGHRVAADRRTADELAVLYTQAVFYGLGTGVVLDTFTEPDSAAAGVLPVLALGGLAAGGVALLDHGVQLRYGVPQSIASGMMIGLEEGFCWLVWNQARVPGSDEWSIRSIAAAVWGTATMGAVVGGVVGHAYGTTPGRASLMGSAALWSGLVGGMVMGAATSSNKHAMLTSALALNVGAVGGVLLGASSSPSIARVRFVDLGGLAGGILFGGLYIAAVGDSGGSGEGALAVTSLGIAVGLGTAWALTRDMDPDLGPTEADKKSAHLVPLLAPASHGGMVAGVGAVF